MIREAVSFPAQATAVCLRFSSPVSGNRSNQSTAFEILARIRNQVRKVVGSI
jgi:hypothetical protein